MWATLIFTGTATLFVLMTCAALWHLHWVRRLPSLAALNPSDDCAREGTPLARCSIVVAARDEKTRIEATIRHLRAQRGIDLELILVDDRSTDGTTEILRRLVKEDPRLHVKRIEALPDGWLGKCHACHVGASAATGDWILFTDADCWLKPDVIDRAIRVAERERADHVTLAAGTVMASRAARGWYLLFLISLLNWFSGVNRDRRKAHVGIGAFNLVHAEAYRQCGGYAALRLTVLDDVKLGLLLARAGKRTRGFLGGEDVECHWGHTVGSLIRILEKNYFAALNFELWPVIGGTVVMLALFCVLLLGAVSGTPAGLAALAAPLLLTLPALVLARRLGWSWGAALATPFMLPVMFYTMLNSTWVTLRQGGIRWRDTFYALETLRAGMVR